MTPLTTIQSWSRDQLESAFTQREGQLAEYMEKDSVRTKEHNILVQENRDLSQQAKRLEADAACLRCRLIEVKSCISEWRTAGLILGTLDLERLTQQDIDSTTAGRSLLERLERYEKALKELSVLGGGRSEGNFIAQEALRE